MDLQNALAPAHVRPRDNHPPVEAARPQQRRVEHVGAVGGGHQNDALIGVEAVHLDEQLIQRLLALVVPASQAGAAVAAHGVDLVDEDDAGRALLALLEQVADAAGADADEHLHEVGARNREERNVRLARNRAGQQGLARARRADQQNSLGNPPAQLLKLLRLAEELDNLLQLFLGLLDARDVLEGHFLLLVRQQPGAALAEAERLVPAGLHLPHHENPEGDDQDERRDLPDHGPEIQRRRVFQVDLHVLRRQLVIDSRIILGDHRAELLARGAPFDLLSGNRDFLNVALVDLGHESR